MVITVHELEEILEIFENSDFEELLLETSEMRVRVRRNGKGVALSTEDAPAQVDPDPSDEVSDAPARAGAVQEPVSNGDFTDSPSAAGSTVPVKAPVSGTFYRAPAPTEPPFIEVGSRVSVGDTLGIVEVMKLMMSLTAEVEGEIVEITKGNATAVEVGEVLMYIRPLQ